MGLAMFPEPFKVHATLRGVRKRVPLKTPVYMAGLRVSKKGSIFIRNIRRFSLNIRPDVSV